MNMDRRQLSVVLGVWLVAATFISSPCSAARGLESEQPADLEMVVDNRQLELVGEARYFGTDELSREEILRDEASDYLTPHNNARKAVGANIPNLTWSTTLANYARNWAITRANAGCGLVHSGGQYGENIYWSSGQSTPADAVNLWVAEKSNYNYNSNTCASGKVCGHYTQVVWRNTKTVGCGSASCSGGGKFVVCSYDPPGNWVGERPY